MSPLLAAQIWAIVTNLFLVLPVAVMWHKQLVHVHMLETAWFTILAFVSTMHHICDPVTDLVWSCQNNRENIAFTELLFAYGSSICVVMPFVHQRHVHMCARLRLVLFPLMFFMLLVDPANGLMTFGVLFVLLLPLFAWAIHPLTIRPGVLFASVVLGSVGFVMYGLAHFLRNTNHIDTVQQLWIHGAWHIPISIAMSLLLWTLMPPSSQCMPYAIV